MHLGYAIQWFVIAAVLLAGGGAMLRLKSGRGHP
jgi:cytochrome oxidase assembly protein ShyY1